MPWVGEKLKRLRLARGMSLDDLAAAMGGVVTKQAISKYELGKSQPSPRVQIGLAEALSIKASYFWKKPEIKCELIAYRKKSHLPRKEQDRIEQLVCHLLEERVCLQSLLNEEDSCSVPVRFFPVKNYEEIEEAAEDLRKDWGLGKDPIADVTAVLEDHCIHVIEVKASKDFDGISAIARAGSKKVVAAAVVTRADGDGERMRLNLTHELGHLSLLPQRGIDEEKAAFRFGSAFLAPRELILHAIGRSRSFIDMRELLILKKRLGMSVQASIHRLHDLNIINSTHYKRWWIDLSRLGWRTREPGELPRERPQWLERSVLRALSEDVISREEGERLLGTAVNGAEPISLIQKKALMKLPLEERRKLLREQASKALSHYKEDNEWHELEGGDLVEK